MKKWLQIACICLIASAAVSVGCGSSGDANAKVTSQSLPDQKPNKDTVATPPPLPPL